MVQLKDHQKLPVEFIKKQFGLILYHSTGTGKTITSLVSMYQFNRHIVIIGPKSSKKAFEDEIKKLKLDRSQFTIYTYAKIKRIMYDDMEMLKNKCVIVDEAHNLRNETRDNMFLAGILSFSHKVILLTATPVINYINDISPLINIVSQDDVLPSDRKLFNFFYYDEENMRLQNHELLRGKLKDKISYYEKEDKDDYPESGTVIKKIIMTNEQIEEYGNYVKKLVFYNEIPPEGQSLFDFDFARLKTKRMNAFLTATRQLSNTIDGDINSPKIKEIVTELKNNPLPAIVYSNFLKNGVYPVAKKLDMENVSYKLITGNTTQDKIVKVVNGYNEGKYDVLLLSSAGSESLDLKNTRQIHIMEPHWNEPKIDQVIGRAIRYKSHSSLPLAERNVTIYRWVSIFDKNKYANVSADEYLIDLSEKKRKIFEFFKGIIVEMSIESQQNTQKLNKKLARIYKEEYKKYVKRYNKLKR